MVDDTGKMGTENRFSYLIPKIENAPTLSDPFDHIEIEEFFHPDDFQAITQSPEVKTNHIASDDVLFKRLFDSGYKMVPFPGAITNSREYLHKRRTRSVFREQNTACESQGVVLRLNEANSDILNELQQFISSSQFLSAIAQKFNLDLESCTADVGLQKYLSGYEISPHPDMRKKAATFMVNINPHESSTTATHHTHYLRFKAEKAYVQEYWRGNPSVERCWVPWDWCETVKQQSANNSFVAFAPSDDTMHAVKASYNHLKYQRTQLYGNLWRATNYVPPTKTFEWEAYQLPYERKTSPAKKGLRRFMSVLDKLRYVEARNNVDRSRRSNY